MVVLGTLVLAFGWFGFNGASTYAGTDLRLAVVVTNSMLAAAAGAAAATLFAWWRTGKPDVGIMCNGHLAGLVAITAPCAFVSAPSAVLLGAAGGILATLTNVWVERKLRIDDPVGALGVHGACGVLGILGVGLLADGTYGDGTNGVAGGVRGLFYGDPGQLAASLIGLVALAAWVIPTCWVAFQIVGRLVGNRVSEATELTGLDLEEVGVLGYSHEG